MTRLCIAEEFVDRARHAQSRSDLFCLLQDATSEIGFRYFALVQHVDLRNVTQDAIRIENYPESWASYFIEHSLYAEDPVHQACLRTNVTFAWSDVPRMIPLSSRQKSILEEAAKHGLCAGVTIPAIIPGESTGSCSFAVSSNAPMPDETNVLIAQVVGGFAFQAARRLLPKADMPTAKPPRLSPRQRDCLLLAIRGKTDWEISRILGLSEETVSQHLNMARARYGVGKRIQLAVHAIFDGQISLTEALAGYVPLKRE